MENTMTKTIVINNEFMGHGDDELGRQLMGSFLRKLNVRDNLPDNIVFYNSGVKLLAKSSTVLDAIDLLLTAGVNMQVCGTCMNKFGIADQIESHLHSDMVSIIDILMKSDIVITL
jgi:intracellular sulfur oxidation DsrE/DsrF family protein